MKTSSVKGFLILLFTYFSFPCLYPQDLINSEQDELKAYFDYYRFSEIDKDAQNWNGMFIASNNKIYIGLCTHGDAANLYEFDITSRSMKHLANLTKILGESSRSMKSTFIPLTPIR